MASIRHKRGTRAQIDAAAAGSQLRTGEVYLITDEARLTVGTASSAHSPLAKQSEAGGGGSDPWSWSKLAADVANSTTTLAPVTGLNFSAAANTTYLVELVGAFQSAASTTGIALALDIPSGAVAGQLIHNVSATGLGGTEQSADNATTGATTGVRAAASNVTITARWIVAIGSTGGTVQLQFRSEVAASAVTMKAALTAMGRRTI
jgi:chemotaxis response regulator CheB